MTRSDPKHDPAAFPPFAVAVDVVLLALAAGSLHVLLGRRAEQPARGRLALPGVFVGIDEELDAAAARAVRIKAGVDASVRQFHAFGGVHRDPRMRIVTVGYLSLVTADRLKPALDDSHQLLRVDGGTVRGSNGRRQALPFDHSDIVAAAVAALRADIDVTPFSFGLLPPEFSLRELQIMHEAVRGRSLNKPAFRKRLIESGRIEATGRLDSGTGFRPAELYRVKENAVGDA